MLRCQAAYAFVFTYLRGLESLKHEHIPLRKDAWKVCACMPTRCAAAGLLKVLRSIGV